MIELYDIETLINCFTYTGYDFNNKEYYQFVVHEDMNQFDELYKHLIRGINLQVGYNNENFDYIVIHYIIKNYKILKTMSGFNIANMIYQEAQRVINSKDYVRINDKNKFIKQLDLFLIWHYDNKSKMTSLKDLEFVMNMPNIEEMPFNHYDYIDINDIPSILDYNKNDVEATYLFLLNTLGKTEYTLYKNKDKIQLRYDLKKEYGLECLNFNDVKIGEQLLLKLYCKKTGLNPYDVKKLRTLRPIINISDCIPKWCNFKTDLFNNKLVNEFNKISIYNGVLKDAFDLSLIYNNIKMIYGSGGVHACIKSGVYEEDENFIIMDVDIDGQYPSLEIIQGIYPEHLGKEFIEILDKEIVSVRKAEKKKPNKEDRKFSIIEGFKLASNGSYGKSNEENSWLYDPLYTMKTTIPGQIIISMWVESICENISDITILQVNTDGWTFKIRKTDVDKAIEISNNIINNVGLTYEINFYKKMVINDVNNYLAEYQDSTPIKEHIKYKGCFEIDKEYHKDSSMKIVPIALKNYFINNIPIEETIKNHKNIYDFCLRLKINSSTKAYYNEINKELDNKLLSKKLNRTTRYYISNDGGSLSVYYNNSDSVTRINKGYVCTLFNRFINSDNYNINYKFYEIETRKIINSIEDKQLSMFN